MSLTYECTIGEYVSTMPSQNEQIYRFDLWIFYSTWKGYFKNYLLPNSSIL